MGGGQRSIIGKALRGELFYFHVSSIPEWSAFELFYLIVLFAVSRGEGFRGIRGNNGLKGIGDRGINEWMGDGTRGNNRWMGDGTRGNNERMGDAARGINGRR